MIVRKESTLDSFMGENDWALIFDDLGQVKGLFIPQGSDEAEVPKRIINILKAAGIDLEDPDVFETYH